MTKPIAITCGDPAGVGPEIIERYLAENPMAEVVIIGAKKWLETLPNAQKIAVGDEGFCCESGKPSIEGAKVALAALKEAAQGTKEGRYKAVVTAPVSKHWLQQAGYKFPGQTEFFADHWGGDPSMCFAGGRLQVTLVTWHIPLDQVAAAITKEKLKLACASAALLAKATGAAAPRLAVCGINPHAGEGGLIGAEEHEQINPWLAEIRAELGLAGLSDALPGDTVFQRQLRGDFDGVIAMYHDQGLAPLKTLEFDQAVNCTIGLPFIRTSPDHGTAFGIAGKGVASIASFANAVKLAHQLEDFKD